MIAKIGKCLLAFAITMTGFSSFLEVRAEEKQQPKKLEGNAIAEIKAKSTQNLPIEHAFDGKMDTYWQSPRSSQNVGVSEYKYDHNRYIDITLDGTYSLSSINLFNKEGSFYNYYIYGSVDGDSYERIASKTNEALATTKGDTITFDKPVTLSYLRINMAYNSAQVETNIKEIEFYGTKTSTKVSEPTKINVSDFADSEWSTKWENFESNEVLADNKTITEIQGLVTRVVGAQHVNKFKFELREQANVTGSDGNDVFEIESMKGKIVIRGNDGVSLASGFNYYLKYYCNVDYNPLFKSSTMTLPATLPVVDKKVVKETLYDYRYALNFCTYSYTMSFWGWDEYEEFIDWAAMNGVNLVLDIIGQEEVLRRFLNSYGYTDAEVRDYITGPAYYAWFYMQNMDSFGGPLPSDWFEQRTELGRAIHDRMQAYSIDPVMQGFSGMVPMDFAAKSGFSTNDVLDVGDWPGFKRPFMIRTHTAGSQDATKAYEESSKRFYDMQKEVFGDVTSYYAVDPFHEGGNLPAGMSGATVWKQVQTQMLANNGDDSIWVMQQWQGHLGTEKLNALPKKENAIVLDLQTDMNPANDRTESTGVPWIWNMLHNFGGRMGMDGEVSVIANNPPKAMANNNYMVGIGITPEALENSPIVYELLFDMTWEQDPIDYKEWTYKYAQRRYNIANDNTEAIADMNAAYDILLETVYKDKAESIQGAAESVVNSRPTTNYKNVSTWGHSIIAYDKVELEKAVALFAKHYDILKSSPAFVYDFVDLQEQVLSNSAVEYHKLMAKALENKDASEFKRVSDHFLELIKLSDEVLGASDEFLLGTWIDQSRTMLDNDAYQMDDWSRDLFEFNARTLVTTWGSAKNGSLKDYSNRKWAGLTEEYYLQRWSIWVDNRTKELNNEGAQRDPNWFLWEWQWANRKSDGKGFATEANNLNLKETSATIMEKYSMTNFAKFGEAVEEKVNVALGKPIEANQTAGSGNTQNLVDNNTGTGFIYSKTDDNVVFDLDFNGIAQISEFDLFFNQAAGIKPYTYKVEYFDVETNAWELASEQTTAGVESKVSFTLADAKQATKIRYTFKTTNLTDFPVEVTELAVYGKMIKNIEYENYAYKKPVVQTVGKPENDTRLPANVTDGIISGSSLWITLGGKGTIEIDLEETKVIEVVELYFEKPGLPFEFKVNAIDEAGLKTEIFSNDGAGNTIPFKMSIPYNKSLRKIEVEMIRNNGQGEFPGAYPAISEVKALAQKHNDTAEFGKAGVNVALGKVVTIGGNTTESENTKNKVVDGNVTTYWDPNTRDSAKWNFPVSIDLDGTHYLETVKVHLEKAGAGFKYTAKIVDKDDKVIMIRDMSKTGEIVKTIDGKHFYDIEVNDFAKKVIIELTGNGVGTVTPGAWPRLYEVEAITGKPTSVSTDASITSEGVSAEDLATLLDDNVTTFIALEGKKDIFITLPAKKDVNMFEIVKEATSENPLKYSIAYQDDAGSWQELVDMSSNNNDKVSNTYTLDKVIRASEFRFTIFNEAVTLRDINIFEGIATGPLSAHLAYVKGVLAAKTLGDYAGNYPEAAATTLQTALDAAQVKIDEKVNAEVVKVEIAKLDTALEAFLSTGPIVIKRNELTVILSEVEIALKACTKEALVAELKVAYDSAKAVHEKAKVTQAEIDKAIRDITTAYAINKEILESIVAYDRVLIEANKQVSNTLIGDSDGQVSEVVKTTLTTAIEKAQSDVATSGTSVATIAGITADLRIAIIAFENAKVTIDKAGLLEAILEAKTNFESKDTFTRSSWATFEKTYGEATKTANAIGLTSAKVESDKTALVDATNALIKRGNSSELESLLFTYVNSSISEDQISEASWVTYQAQLVLAQALLNNPKDASQDDVNKAKIALEDAYTSLIGNSDALVTLISEKAAIAQTGYTKASWDVLQSALATARIVVENASATYIEIQAEIKAINEAVSNLVASADHTVLIDKITALEALNLSGEPYTASTWEAYTNMLIAAKALIAQDDASSEAIATMVTDLDAVYTALEVDRSKLVELLAQAKAFIQTDYTVDSWNALTVGISSAQTILEQEQVTYEEVTTAFKALRKAIDDLETVMSVDVLKGIVESYRANLDLVEANYNKVSFDAFDQALTEAEALLSNLSATTEALMKANEAITKAHGELISIKELKAAVANVEDSVSAEASYTTTTWQTLQDTLSNTKKLYTEACQKADISNAMSALDVAFKALEERGNSSELVNLIEAYKGLKTENFTAETWAVYVEKLTAAQAVVANPEHSNQATVDAAKLALQEAKANLVMSGSGYLRDSIAKIDAMLKDKELYTTNSWTALESVLASAKIAVEDPNANYQEALDALEEAQRNLVKRGDKSELAKAIQEFTSLKQGDYTEATWKVYASAYTSANVIFEHTDANQQEVDDTVAALANAKEALVQYNVDKAILKALVVEANQRVQAQYTSESWKLFKEALDKAKAVDALTQTTQATVDEVVASLTDTTAKLVKRGDKTSLLAMISEYANVKETVYTQTTYNAFRKTYEKAIVVKANQEATQAMVDDALNNLQTAYKNLVLKGDKAPLQAYVAFMATLSEADYTTASWTIFAKASSLANDVLANDNATAKDIQTALTAMKTGYDQLVKIYISESTVVIDGQDMEVSMKAPTNVVDPNATLQVHHVSDAKTMDFFKTAMGNDVVKYIVVDIHLLLEGVKVQPNGNVEIQMMIPQGYDIAKLKLFYINDSKERSEIVYRIVGDKLVFETDHFSYYAFAEMSEVKPSPDKPDSNEPVAPGEETTSKPDIKPETKPSVDPDTGDTRNSSTFMVVSLLSLCMMGFISKKQKEENES